MNIEEILSLLPEELLNDAYFANLSTILMENLNSGVPKLLNDTIVSSSIYDLLKNKTNVTRSTDNTLLHILVLVKNKIISLGITTKEADFHVYLEIQEEEHNKKSILIKCPYGSIVETKKITKVNGYYQDYEIEVYHYNPDYTPLKADKAFIEDQRFSADFGIPLSLARYMRHNFSKYAINLSRSATEEKMKKVFYSIPKEEYFFFQGPTTIAQLKSYMLALCLKHNNYPQFLNRIDNIILGLSQMIDSTSEIIISNTIIKNLLPSILGLDADGYYIEGFIIEKNDNKFILYELKIITNDIEHNKQEITKEELEELLTINPANANNQDIINFLNSFNRN